MVYDEILTQFNEVMMYSQNGWFKEEAYFDLDFSELFNKWYRNKTDIRKLLPFFENNKFIYEYPTPVSFGLDENTKRERLDRFVRELWDFPILQDFLRVNKPNFFENRVVEDYKAPYGTARRGMKIIKAFKFFFHSDNENLKRLQNEASAIMNEDKLEGTFCISIHPLDYISISDNDHNWHSCHSLDSDYRAGNLSYMADKHTVVCYIKTGDNRKINNFPESVPWNSKRWRVLLFFDSNCNFVMASKQYPVQSEDALNFFREVYKKACEGKYTSIYGFSPWHKEQVKSVNIDGYEYKFAEPMIPVGQHMAPIHKLYEVGMNALQYNDILKNDKYRKEVRYSYLIHNVPWSLYNDAGIEYPELEGLHTANYLFRNTQLPLIIAGEEVNCPVCGLDVIRTADSILCDRCTLKYYSPELLDEDYYPTCDRCGTRFIYYDGSWYNGQRLCPECSENYNKDYWEDEMEKYKED